jgi:chemotaxis protein MotB
MKPNANVVPIIIKKKVVGGGGHHGGAWKVAYADFVTAMMAFFIVLWLMNASPEAQEAIGGYFRDPSGVGKMRGSSLGGNGEGLILDKAGMEDVQKKIEQAIKKTPEFQKIMKDNVQMMVTGEGLRIELLETEKGLFFESGSPAPSKQGQELIVKLAHELGKLPNPLVIEGHTDSKPFSQAGQYSNWELSTDRANAARRLMLTSGLRPDQVKQVRGYSDQKLRHINDPEAASNRRVSVIVRYSAEDRKEGALMPEKPVTADAHAAPAEAKGH